MPQKDEEPTKGSQKARLEEEKWEKTLYKERQRKKRENKMQS